MGKVAYRLQLSTGSQIHPVFHVSLLKPKLGPRISPSQTLPDLNEEGKLKVYPDYIMKRRVVKRGRNSIVEVLVKWVNLDESEATWEEWNILCSQFPDIDLEDKVLLKGGGNVMSMDG